MSQHQQLAEYLQQLQLALQQHQLWSDTLPSASALASSQPFSVDTLAFEQWLQFIMIPRFQALIDANNPLPVLPRGQGIATMAEVTFRQRAIYCPEVLRVIRLIDQHLEPL